MTSRYIFLLCVSDHCLLLSSVPCVARILCVSDHCLLLSSVPCVARLGSATGDLQSSYKGKFIERLIQGSVAQVLWLRFRLGKKNHVEFFFFLEKCCGHPEDKWID
jgi:hypothetical protein